MNMSAAKIRKIYDKGRIVNSEWCTKFIVVPHNQSIFCLVCQITIVVMKEYIKRHYTTKHSSQFVGQARVDKTEHLKKSIKKTRCFTTCKKDSELVSKLSFKLCECMVEKVKPFSDREFIKDCLTIFTEYTCLEKKYMAEQTSLSHFTVLPRTNDLSDNIKEILKERLISYEAFSLALYETTYISDTVQLVIFIRPVTAD